MYENYYQQHIKNVKTGECGICVQRPSDDCPTIVVALNSNPQITVAWPKTDCTINN